MLYCIIHQTRVDMSKYPLLNKSGWGALFLSFSCTLIALVNNYFWISFVFLLLTICLAFIFRDPHRKITSHPLAIVSPVDGIIKSISPVYSQYTNQTVIEIKIKNQPYGGFAIRNPIEGKVLCSSSKQINGQTQFMNWVQTDEGDDILYYVVTYANIQLNYFVQPGERIGHGQRCGFSPFITELCLQIPDNSQINLHIGSRVQAGTDIVASLVHKDAARLISDATLEAAQFS